MKLQPYNFKANIAKRGIMAMTNLRHFVGLIFLKHLIYCQAGTRSGKSLAVMKEIGYVEAYNMLGGIARWKTEGFPIIS